MSICAHIFVLFREPVTEARIAAIDELISNRTGVPVPAKREEISDDRYWYDRFLPVPEADLCADVSEDGTLNILRTERHSKLLGEPSIEGRLYENNTMSRHWREGYAEGPAIQFALTMMTLIDQPDVQWVWYTDDYKERMHKAMARTDVHQLIDDFIRVGKTNGGRPTRYVYSDSGVISI